MNQITWVTGDNWIKRIPHNMSNMNDVGNPP